jgi:hypothetical protein
LNTKALVCCWALILFVAGAAHATEQRKDSIVLDGGTHDLLNFPLGNAWDWGKAAQEMLRGQGCSGAWRGYQAFWEIRGEQLWLLKVHDNPCGDDHQEIPLSVIVPDAGSTPLPATWLTCRLLVGYGGFVEGQIPQLNYQRYLMLTVEKGRITRREFQDPKAFAR